MPTTQPAPEWDWYDNTDLKIGESRFTALPFSLLEHEAEEWLKELREREAKRIPLGFQLPKRRRK